MSSPPPSARHTVAIAQVVQLLAGARERGLDEAQLLARVGIPVALLASERARVTPPQYAALIKLLARRMGDELWGLCSRPVPPGSFATACRLAQAQPTLGPALRAALRHAHPLLGDFRARLSEQADGQAELRIAGAGPTTPGQNFAQRALLLFGFGFACWLVGRRIPVDELIYDGDHATPRQDASRLFNAPVRLASGVTGCRFSARWLQLPVVRSPDELQAFLRAAPGNVLLKYRDGGGLGERIRRRLRQHLHQRLPSLEAVAEAEGLSPTTLRRHLDREGQGFQALKDGLRRDVAVDDLVHHPELTLADIALRLGYSEASAFHRAFKEWTGLAPGAYRQLHRRAAAE
ncbi:MAG: AraC family transcriptional regulator [Burkholderiaceae bacterium]|nr:AraC family transcriptional regulator [Burkholderiaceae bacterium]